METADVRSVDSLTARVRREDLAIRTVAATLRSALREIRSPDAIEQRDRLAGMLAWARDSIRAHEDVVAKLRLRAGRSLADGGPAVLEADLAEIRDLVAAGERVLGASRLPASAN